MNPIQVRNHDVTLVPQSTRVIIRPFIPSNVNRILTILGRALALSEEDAARDLEAVEREFEARHFDFETPLLATFERVIPHLFTGKELTRTRKLLIGALFSGEYALESAALFNPSMVLHPDQSGAPEGAVKFIMSLRATGEGHISSIEFRTGLVAADGGISLDPVSRLVTEPIVDPNPSYRKAPFLVKLHEMGFDNSHAGAVMDLLSEGFTRDDLNNSVQRVRRESRPHT